MKLNELYPLTVYRLSQTISHPKPDKRKEPRSTLDSWPQFEKGTLFVTGLAREVEDDLGNNVNVRRRTLSLDGPRHVGLCVHSRAFTVNGSARDPEWVISSSGGAAETDLVFARAIIDALVPAPLDWDAYAAVASSLRGLGRAVLRLFERHGEVPTAPRAIYFLFKLIDGDEEIE
jgi:hypothetical protein